VLLHYAISALLLQSYHNKSSLNLISFRSETSLVKREYKKDKANAHDNTRAWKLLVLPHDNTRVWKLLVLPHDNTRAWKPLVLPHDNTRAWKLLVLPHDNTRAWKLLVLPHDNTRAWKLLVLQARMWLERIHSRYPKNLNYSDTSNNPNNPMILTLIAI
jgi:hypothetical protein